MSQITFQRIGTTNLYAASTGDAGNRIIFIRSAGNMDNSMERIEGTNIILVGGEATRTHLVNLLSEHGRPTVNEMIPGGITGRPYVALRAYLKIKEHSHNTPTRYLNN